MARALRKGLHARINPVLCTQDNLGAPGGQSFVLACWMAHEVPDQAWFFAQVFAMLAPGGKFLVAEPKFHVSKKELEAQRKEAEAAGLVYLESPRFALSNAVLFERPEI